MNGFLKYLHLERYGTDGVDGITLGSVISSLNWMAQTHPFGVIPTRYCTTLLEIES